MFSDLLIPKIGAYRRNSKIILIPQSQAKNRAYREEYFLVNKPVEFSYTADITMVGKNVLEAFSYSQLVDQAPPEGEEYPFKSMYPRLGVNDWNHFTKNVDSCFVSLKDNNYQFVPVAGSRVLEDKKISVPEPSDVETLGNALIQAFDLSKALNPFAVKYTNPQAGAYPNELAPEVKEQLIRLGGKMKENVEPDEQMVVGQFLVPKAIHQFFSYHLPHKYCTHESDYKTYMIWGLEIHGDKPSYLNDEIVIADRYDRFLVSFGYADGGNYFLAFDLKEFNPSDPAVFKIDHFDPEQRIYGGFRLSAFLSDLMPEER